MILETVKYDKAINPAYFKLNLKEENINLFKTHFKRLFERINENESEEHNKNIVSQFLRDTFYKNDYEINTAGRKDLVIHKGNTSQTPVSIIIEAKSPTNKTEMLSFEKPNAKAFHETIHYFLHERIIKQNKEIKHVIITNIYNWFIFDAVDFEKLFYANKTFKNSYQDWHDKKLLGNTTDWFYNEIAKPFVETEIENLNCVFINLLEYEQIIKNENLEEDSKLINLYKILSPENLLKLPFANDFNKIDTAFYNELLYILGLEETKDGGKKIIKRAKDKNRKEASLLEITIGIIEQRHRLKNIERLDLFGNTADEQIFSIALELCITWLNRILFLKLLEAQLIKYHKGNTELAFLSKTRIKDFDELDELFFEVLAKKPEIRTISVNQKFGNLPYLNSSLFEETVLEEKVLFASQLKDRLFLPILSNSVLKQSEKFKNVTEINTLEYIFEFLNAFNFSSDQKAEIQKDNKTIINAAVLGLIFEKINGYKDGSFYTPSFITTFISREILKSTIIQKFSKTLNKNIKNFEQLKDLIEFSDKEERQKANDIINSIKICDPAVGSGHFLVSILNELVSIKSELKILQYTNGNRIKGIKISNSNDELEIIDEETSEPFQYYVSDKHQPIKELQEIQHALFNEKRTLIEKCLFGVDINPKSVLICRLRLWIELLKSSYYTEYSNFKFLETLPNIDINIVTGNSLISKFDKGLNIFEKQAVKNLIYIYKTNSTTYKTETDYDKKIQSRRTIENIKQELLKYAIPQDKHYKLFLKKSRELQNYIGIKPQTADIQKQIVKLSGEVAEHEKKYQENYYNVYTNSLEWALEFPEILTDEGEFVGFDIIVGNPPYFSISNEPKLKEVNENYTIYKQTADIYTLFIERGLQVLKTEGRLSFIVSNKWLRAAYGENLREFLLKNTTIEKLIDFDGLKVFDEANVDTSILQIVKHKNGKQTVEAVRFDKTFNLENESISEYFENNKIQLNNLTKDSWYLKSEKENALKLHLEKVGKPLKDWNVKINRGITTGFNEAFVIDNETKQQLIKEDKKNSEIIKPLLRGRDIGKYSLNCNNLWLINTYNGFILNILDEEKDIIKHSNKNFTITDENGFQYKAFRIEDARGKQFRINRVIVEKDYPTIYNYLKKFETQLINRDDKGNHWTNLRNCAYNEQFAEKKLVFTKASQDKSFAFDDQCNLLLNTSYFITGDNLKYLLGILNSKLTTYAFLNFYQSGGIEGEITVQAINEIPIPEITETNKSHVLGIEINVDKILKLKQENSENDISELMQNIEELIYQLYELKDEHIALLKKND